MSIHFKQDTYNTLKLFHSSPAYRTNICIRDTYRGVCEGFVTVSWMIQGQMHNQKSHPRLSNDC